jgi:hypothetical protein
LTLDDVFSNKIFFKKKKEIQISYFSINNI